MTVATQYPVCRACGSTDIMRDAWAAFEPLTNSWVLGDLWQGMSCRVCDQTEIILKPYTEKERIRLLNDALRTGAFRGEHDRVVMTVGVTAQGDEFIQRTIRAVAEFTAFTPDNDPHEEHDFGQVIVDGRKIFFKHDCYDLAMEGLSPDPADPAVTARVLTLMLADEY